MLLLGALLGPRAGLSMLLSAGAAYSARRERDAEERRLGAAAIAQLLEASTSEGTRAQLHSFEVQITAAVTREGWDQTQQLSVRTRTAFFMHTMNGPGR